MSRADPLIDCATSFATNHAQVPEPIGSLCMIVGLAPRVTLYEWRRQNLFLSIKITSIPQNSLISFLPEAYSANKSTSSSSKLPLNQSFKVRSPLRILTAKIFLLLEPPCDMQASKRYLHTNEFVALHRSVDKTFQTHRTTITIKGEIFCPHEHWTTHVVS